MMKVLLIGSTKIRYMPYIQFYLNIVDLEIHNVHVLYWNRDGKEDDISNEHITYHEFGYLQQDEVAKIKKIKGFILFKKYILDVIRRENFDFIIVLHSIPGVLISTCLIKNYSNKYIFDYRDQTYENYSVFRKKMYCLVENSYATFVSSDAFRKLLPSINKIYTSHNILQESLFHRDGKKVKHLTPIRIAFWGFIRHKEINRQIISSLANDGRFELHYYGREQDTAYNLKKFVVELGAKNVFFHGEYKPEDRYFFSMNTDLIHNMYSNTELPPTALAMGNKYYDGIIFYLPQICTINSFMGDEVVKAGVGMVCNPYEANFPDLVWTYYNDLDLCKFNENCDIELNRVLYEYKIGISIIKRVLTE